MRNKVIFGALIGVIVHPAAAQDEAGRADRLVDALAQCRPISDGASRLACLDAAADAILAAREKREVLVIDREGVRQAKRSLFGFSLPKIRLFGRGNDAEDVEPEVKSIDSQITSVALVERTLWSFRLADGSQWKATEVMRFPPRAGDPIRIEAGILGSYRAKIREQSAGKVIRLR